MVSINTKGRLRQAGFQGWTAVLGEVRNWSGPASVPLKINSKKHRCVFRIQLGLCFKCLAVVINGFANRDYRAADSAEDTLHVMNVC